MKHALSPARGNVSHDLRTPLSIIRGYIETVLMKERDLSPEERRGYLETILSSTDRLRTLVDELFELSVLEARETQPKKEPFSVGELVQDIVQKNLIRAESQNITLMLDADRNLPFIHADIGMMEKVFQNLLDNALKFTPSGGKVSIILRNDATRGILVRVQDTGCGIPPEELPQLFSRFYQGHRVPPEEPHGTGLGLAIVKRILDLHGFRIRAESEPAKGTTFVISIPV